jgi:hypothetical protein
MAGTQAGVAGLMAPLHARIAELDAVNATLTDARS